MHDSTSGQMKKALKGIHSETLIDSQDFIEVLYNNSNIMRDQTRFRRSLKQFTVQMHKQKKRALNSVYFKLRVSEDFLTCSPHVDSNGEYLWFAVKFELIFSISRMTMNKHLKSVIRQNFEFVFEFV